METARYESRLADVAAFNELHRYKKRGIAVTPTKFGISFEVRFMNQVRHTMCGVV